MTEAPHSSRCSAKLAKSIQTIIATTLPLPLMEHDCRDEVQNHLVPTPAVHRRDPCQDEDVGDTLVQRMFLLRGTQASNNWKPNAEFLKEMDKALKDPIYQRQI